MPRGLFILGFSTKGIGLNKAFLGGFSQEKPFKGGFGPIGLVWLAGILGKQNPRKGQGKARNGNLAKGPKKGPEIPRFPFNSLAWIAGIPLATSLEKRKGLIGKPNSSNFSQRDWKEFKPKGFLYLPLGVVI